jgi:outer membrane protein assembly factor BamA
VQKNIENAARKMVTHLKRNGHLQAELLSVNSEINPQNKALITIQIDEGILTYVRQILFMGSKSFSNLELREEVGIETNKPLKIKEVEESFEKLELFYKRRAYLEFKIKNRNASVIQYKPDQPYADIVYQVSEGPKIRVQNIKVTGLKKTKEYVVMRELSFGTDELLTLEKVSNSIDRLEKTGLFGKVNIRSLEQGSKKQNRTIVVEVEERKPGVFSAGAGIFNEGFFGYRGYLGALYNNLWGKARGISSRVDLKYLDLKSQIGNAKNFLENRIALSYYEPFIFKDRVRGRISLIREQQVFDINASAVRSTNDIILATEKEFTRHFRFIYNVWSFSNQETFSLKDNETNENSNQTINIGSTGPIVEIDYRNDQFLPTDGTFSRIEFEYSDPIFGSSKDNPQISGFEPANPISGVREREDNQNEIQFIKTSFSHTLYSPLTKDHRWVWANSIRGGYSKNVSSRADSGIPQAEQFYLGGSSTIRGFAFGPAETVPGKRELCIKQGIIDYDEPTDQCNFNEIFVRDDSAFVLFKSELRFPISGAFGGLIFYDGGAVYLGDFSLEDPYRDAVGLGFRYDTPVGSFIMQAGYKLDRKLGGPNSNFDRESDLAFHVSIGTF